MTAVKLKLPPGFYQNGTPYGAAGRYHTGDLVRWHNDLIKPVGGWQRRFDFATTTPSDPLWPDGTATEAARSGIVIGDETLGNNAFIGTNKAIYRISNSNVVTNVTPAGFVGQDKDSQSLSGYGTFRYSFGQYGTPRPEQASRVPNAFSWGFAEWGFWPIACARQETGLPLYIKRDTDGTFVEIANSPMGTFDVVVTDERIVMAFGDTQDYRNVQWCDQEDFDTWTPAVDNQAGSKRLAGIGRLVRGVKALGQILIIGENDAFVAQYVGPPYVYGFDRVGNNCGIVGPEAVSVTDTFAAWLGPLSFWMYDGTVKQLPCEVLETYLKTHDKTQRSKTYSFTVSDYSEIWWVYQSKESVTKEPDKYIVYNYAKNIWYDGALDRTVGFDSDPLVYVLMVDSSGYMYDHEVGSAGHGGRTPYVSTGPLEQNNGERLMGMSYVLPDAKTNGDILMELQVRNAADQDDPQHAKLFSLSDPTSTTGVMGRDIRMRLEGNNANPNWEIGDFRILPIKSAGPMR